MECECGCGEKASTRSFKPGHDQKLRISLEHRAGGIIGLRKLVEAAERFSSGQVDSTALAKAVEAIFKKWIGPGLSKKPQRNEGQAFSHQKRAIVTDILKGDV